MLDINALVWRLRQLNCPQDFVLCILLIYWTYAVWEEQYDYYEFFAGIGNLTKQARACGYKALRFDILDSVKREDRKSNFMDLNSASGLQWYPYFKLAVVISQHISP